MIEGIDVLAVPFFFLASGFLCFRDLNYASFGVAISAGTERVHNTIIKLLRLYLIWTLLYFPITIFGNVLLGNSFLHASLSFVRGTLFVGENYYSWPLWYLLASIVGFTLVFICVHRGGWRFKRIIPFSLFLLLLGFGITCVQGWDGAPAYLSVPIKIYCRVFGSSRNGLFEGFFYIAVGAAFGMKWNQLNRVPLSIECAVVAVGLAGIFFGEQRRTPAILRNCKHWFVFAIGPQVQCEHEFLCPSSPHEHDHLPCAYVFRCCVCLRNLRRIKSRSLCV